MTVRCVYSNDVSFRHRQDTVARAPSVRNGTDVPTRRTLMSSQPPTPLPTAFVAATTTATDVVDNAAYTVAAASARSEDGY